ncbi:MAG: cytochrome c biogenesis protein ResB [Chloroflexota bacterium]
MGRAIWDLLTSVNFAVAQIIVLSLLALVGMTVRQLPTFAFRSTSDYIEAMARIHDRYDTVLGVGIVNALERLQVFHIFTSTWFIVSLVVLAASIVVCTLDRTPRLWRQSHEVRVVQPDPFYDPKLPDRAATSWIEAPAVGAVLRRHRYTVRLEVAEDGSQHVYGDRNQYTKLATLLTHTGLILFIVAAAVTTRFGDEQPLLIVEGGSLTVQPVGSPGLLVVKNLDFEAPGFIETGQARDFTTELAVYRNGAEIAHKTIRVNDPLEVEGYTLHENNFGPAPDIYVGDRDGKPLWNGPVPFDSEAGGMPYGSLIVPGRDVLLEFLLRRDADGIATVIVQPSLITGEDSSGQPTTEPLEPLAPRVGESFALQGTDISVGVKGFADYTLLIAKKDPGKPIVWLAFLSLIIGIAITFYLPRRRIWARVGGDGRVAIVARFDRYVDVEREFGRLLDDLVAARRPDTPAAPAAAGSA